MMNDITRSAFSLLASLPWIWLSATFACFIIGVFVPLMTASIVSAFCIAWIWMFFHTLQDITVDIYTITDEDDLHPTSLSTRNLLLRLAGYRLYHARARHVGWEGSVYFLSRKRISAPVELKCVQMDYSVQYVRGIVKI